MKSEIKKKLYESITNKDLRKQIEWCREYHINAIKSGNNGRKRIDRWYFSYIYPQGDFQIIVGIISEISVRNRATQLDSLNVGIVNAWAFDTKTQQLARWSKRMRCFGAYFDFVAEMRTFRGSSYYRYSEKDSCMLGMGVIVKGSRFHSEVVKHGMTMKKSRECNWNDKNVIVDLFKSNYSETIMKSNLYRISGRHIENYEKPLMLCIRYGIIIKPDDLVNFKDTISMMDQYHVDWHNKKYLADWKNQHDRLVIKQQKEREKKKKLRCIQDEQTFFDSHFKWFGICWISDNLSFHTLDSVKEYIEEGDDMHHCVGANKYYLKNNSVIISVRDKDTNKRIATIEIDVKDMSIIQIRAKCNAMPKEYDQIFKSMTENMKRFKAA